MCMKRRQKKSQLTLSYTTKLEPKEKVTISSNLKTKKRNLNGFNLVAPAMSRISKQSSMEVSLQDFGCSGST